MGSTERSWPAIAARPFTANGGSDGKITITTTLGYHVKQKVLVKANLLPALLLEVKRLISATEMVLGLVGPNPVAQDLSSYTVVGNATVETSDLNPRPDIPDKQYERAAFEEDPVNAKRGFLVDQLGNPVADGAGTLNVRDAGGKLVTEKYDDQVFTRDPEAQVITQIDYKLDGNLVATVIIERDEFLNVTRMYRA